jgi:hypothetical protein
MEVLPILSFEALPRRVVHSPSLVMEKIDHQMTVHVGRDHRSGEDCIDAMKMKKNRQSTWKNKRIFWSLTVVVRTRLYHHDSMRRR